MLLPLILKIALVFRDERKTFDHTYFTKPTCPSYALVIKVSPVLDYKLTAGITQLETKNTPTKLLAKVDL